MMQKEKEEAKLLKQVKTQLKKLEAAGKKLKKIPNFDTTENIVIGVVDLSGNALTINDNLCLEVLKTKAKKGTLCGCNIFLDNLCKRHYNLKSKIINQK